MASPNNCDCTKVPFKQECVKYCITLVLRGATTEESLLILGFDPELAQAIYRAFNTINIMNFEDLERFLSAQEINSIISTFGSLHQSKLDDFNNLNLGLY